jgi:hypothetical protein
LAKKPNYDFEKRRKELDRKAKKDAKRAERQRRRPEDAVNDGDEDATAQADGAEANTPTPEGSI